MVSEVSQKNNKGKIKLGPKLVGLGPPSLQSRAEGGGGCCVDRTCNYSCAYKENVYFIILMPSFVIEETFTAIVIGAS